MSLAVSRSTVDVSSLPMASVCSSTSRTSNIITSLLSTKKKGFGSLVARRRFMVCSNMTPPTGVPLPSGSPSGSMRSWVVGIVLTFVLPFFTHKWGPLIALKSRVDTVVDTAEYIMEAIEEVAERVDKVIDNITDELPEDSRLRKSMEAVDELVEGVAKTAHVANHIIDKVEEAGDRLESLII